MGQQLWLSMDITNQDAINQISYYQTIAKNQINGDWEDSSAFHITIDFLAENEDNADIVLKALHEFEQNKLNMYNNYLFGSKLNYFPQGVLWMGVDKSWKLYQTKYTIREILKKYNFIPQDSYDSYTPHITLAYNVSEQLPIHMDTKIAIPFDNITLWNSFKVHDKYVDNILYQIDLRK